MRSRESFPFLFVGAGLANYYEWFNLYVIFRQEPTKQQLKEIVKLAPPPVKIAKDALAGELLMVGSNQYVNRDIHKTYDGSPVKAKKDLPAKFFCSRKAAIAFEKAIETWLTDINKIRTIEMVYRPADPEAGGTEFNEWHNKSVQGLPQMLESWTSSKSFSPSAFEVIKNIIRQLISFCPKAKPEFINRVLQKFVPSEYVVRLLEEKRGNQLKTIAEAEGITDVYLSDLSKVSWNIVHALALPLTR